MKAEEILKIQAIRDVLSLEDNEKVPEILVPLIERMREIEFGDGEYIVRYDAPADDGLYVITEGEALVYGKDDNLLNKLSAGDTVGEMALLDRGKRTASVKASGKIKCINLSSDLFEEMLVKYPKLVTSFMRRQYNKTAGLIAVQEKIKAELEVASTIQATSLEKDFSKFNIPGKLSFIAKMDPAKEVGGDFYDVFWVDDHRLCFVMADVSGKGVPAALFMMMAHIHIRNYVLMNLPLDKAIYEANNRLCEKNEANMFVTAFVCILDFSNDKLYYVNAGHNLPFIKGTDDVFRMFKCKADMFMGLMDEIDYHIGETTFLPGESIYLYTDGVPEAMNKELELYGEERMEEYLNSIVSDISDPDLFTEKIYNEVERFCDGADRTDDITMILLNRQVEK